LLVIVLALGGYVAYTFPGGDDEEQKPENQTSSANEGQESNNASEQFIDDLAKYSIEYPENWTLDRSTSNSVFLPEVEQSIVALTSDTGLEVKIEQNIGGRGGECELNAADSPHQIGNRCPTSETIFVEKTGNRALAIDSTKNSQSQERFREFDMFFTRTKYTEAETGITKYFFGLDRDSDIYPVEVSGPEMGQFVDFSVLSVYSEPDYDLPVDTGYYQNISTGQFGIIF